MSPKHTPVRVPDVLEGIREAGGVKPSAFRGPGCSGGACPGRCTPGVLGGEKKGAAGLPEPAAGGEPRRLTLWAEERVREGGDLGTSQGLPHSLGFSCTLSEFLTKEICAHGLKISDSPGRIVMKS